MSKNDDFESLRERLHRVIPGGAHTYSRGDDQYPQNAPPLLVRGKGAYTWDAEGKCYLDYGMALRAVTLGYADERINQAALAEMENGVNLTRASLTELEAAEALVDLIPSVDMVKFAKNGSNTTTAAMKIARSFTGKKLVCVPRQHPFFSFDDWFIGTTELKRGTLNEASDTTLGFDYGDIASLEQLFEQYPDQIAAVMLEPGTTITPCADSCCKAIDTIRDGYHNRCPSNGSHFLNQVQQLCNEKGALFILDEMITGFRWHLQGAQTYYGVEPDLCTFGKGMANGYAVAAVGGRREIMEVGGIYPTGMERTFLLSTTHGGEMTGLGALKRTIEIYQQEQVVEHMWAYGSKLKSGFEAVAKSHGLENHFLMDGPAISLNFITKNADGDPCLGYRTLLGQELLKRGVLMPCIAVSQSHGDAELSITLDALDGALGVYKQALEGGLEHFLKGSWVKPVFRKFN